MLARVARMTGCLAVGSCIWSSCSFTNSRNASAVFPHLPLQAAISSPVARMSGRSADRFLPVEDAVEGREFLTRLQNSDHDRVLGRAHPQMDRLR